MGGKIDIDLNIPNCPANLARIRIGGVHVRDGLIRSRNDPNRVRNTIDDILPSW